MKIKVVIFIFCSNILCSQNDLCLEYDSLQTIKIDTLHFMVNAFCKMNKESSAFFTYKRKGKVNVLDGKYLFYYKGNIVEEGEYIDGKKEGKLITYYQDNKLKEFIYLVNDSIRFETVYYNNGVVKSNGMTKNGSKVGTWCYYFENGILDTKGNYSYVKVTKENIKEVLDKLNTSSVGGTSSLKDGDWKYYNQDGTLKKREKYERGILKN